MTSFSLNSRNTAWVFGGIALAGALAFLIIVNPLNTTTTQWVGPAKLVAPVSAPK
jgi:hypothetical protein